MMWVFLHITCPIFNIKCWLEGDIFHNNLHERATRPSDKHLLLKIVKKQFHVSALSWWQTTEVRDNLFGNRFVFSTPFLTHCWLYVSVPRIRWKKWLEMVIRDQDGNLTNLTNNVVYKEVLHSLWSRLHVQVFRVSRNKGLKMFIFFFWIIWL